MNLRLDEISRAVAGDLDGPGTLEAAGYSIDTRTLKHGDLFFAIKGPRFDGHDFVHQAIEKGACGVVVEHGNFADPVRAVIKVRSTVAALQALARHVRRRWGKPIVGVTGSAGKTTTKEMIAAVLGKKYTVLRSTGNFNNEYGLPLCLLRVEPSHTAGVLEMGMSAKGEILKLASIAEPNEGVITNVNAVHLEFFDSVDAIAEAKAELLEGLVEPRRAYLNADDPRVRAMASRVAGEVVTYGVETPAAFKVEKTEDLGIGGTAFTLRRDGREIRFVLPLLGRHNVANALAAIAVGARHGVSWEAMQAAISEMKPERMRGEVIQFDEGFVVIDDSYNSNPKALTEMIRFCGSLQGFGRKIIVAGEMLELGVEAAALHRACGAEAARSGAFFVLGVQGLAREIVEGARNGGMPGESVRFVPEAQEAGDLLARIVKSGDVILVKGSRGVKLERTIERLRAAFTPVKT